MEVDGGRAGSTSANWYREQLAGETAANRDMRVLKRVLGILDLVLFRSGVSLTGWLALMIDTLESLGLLK
jgi:hypothetical protein